MTLRVTLEIIPYGDEEKKRKIGHLNISNIGVAPETVASLSPIHEYQVNQYTDGEDATKVILHNQSVLHARKSGAWRLVKDVLNQLTVKGP